MSASLDSNSFSLLGTFTVAQDTRLVSGACNPEKDLVLLIHKAEPRDTLSLWKLQGSKRWEVDVATNFTHAGAMRHIAWSPDGDKFAIGHAVKRVTVHSVLDGCEEYRFDDYSSPLEVPKSTWKMASVAWLKMPWRYFWNQDVSKAPPPQLYPRDYDAPGSALYLFKQLPRLDYKAPLIEVPPPSEVSVSRAPRYSQPQQADGWPALPFNHLAATISTVSPHAGEPPPILDPNERWNFVQSNTCLFAGDNHGVLYPFIHGTYLTGTIETKPRFSHLMSIITGDSRLYFSRLCIKPEGPTLSVLALDGRIFSHQQDQKSISNSDYRIRDILRISTAARDLVVYAWRHCDEIRTGWVGAPGKEGARDWNGKWARVLQSRGQGKPPVDVKADLTSLLLTGLPLSSVLSEHLEHGSQTTERNFKKWWAVISETLAATKHAAELGILTLQRLVSLLWDLYGLAEIKVVSQDFLLDQGAIKQCIETAKRAIGIFTLIADVARREARGFQHFMVWLRGLIPNLPPAEPPLKPFDTLLVNEYISHGFIPSTLDSFFQSSTTTNGSPIKVDNEPMLPPNLEQVAFIALQSLKTLQNRKAEGLPLRQISIPRSEAEGDNDIVATMVELLTQCNTMFGKIASSITATTKRTSDGREVPRETEIGLQVQNEALWMDVILPHSVKQSTFKEAYLQVPRLQEVLLRERLVVTEDGVIHYIMLRLPEQDGRGQQLCTIRVEHFQDPLEAEKVSCAVVDLVVMSGDQTEDEEEDEEAGEKTVQARLLDAQFYDDTQLALVLQTMEDKSRRALSLFDYANCTYHEVSIAGSSINFDSDIIQRFTDGELKWEPISLTRSRVISSIKGGESVSLAVNSKREVAVLLDHDLWTVYSFDMSADDDEVDESQDIDPGASVDEDSMTL